MAGLLTPMNEWTIRAVVLLSLGAHVALVALAGIRRRESLGWRTLVLWLAYQLANWSAMYALSNMSLGGNTSRSRSSPRDQQLVAFWVPFLLMHLGGPDNITAYSLEDTKLSLRQAVTTVLQVSGTSLVIYRQLYVGGNGTLLWASIAMVAVGVAKYFERAWAFRKGDLGRIRNSNKKNKIRLRIQRHGRCSDDDKLSNEEALLFAHDLLHICKGAFADYSVDEDPLKRRTNAKILFSYGWENMCKVVEMELSLMYDILYTKTVVIHTWVGYSIRVASLTATTMVILLFSFWYKRDGHKREDVLVTYTLLGATFLLDVAWLIRATVSTWTYAFLNARPKCWLHHYLLCTGRWHRLRHAVMSLDPRRLMIVIREPIGSYRLWSGTIGQYNLLHECTHHTATAASLFRRLVNLVVSEEIWMEYQHSRGLELHFSERVKKLLFEEIEIELRSAYKDGKEKEEEEKKKKETERKSNNSYFSPANSETRRILDQALGFVPEFQELILIWHITTNVFLLCSGQQPTKDDETTVEAIKALSNYMVFLVTVRPDMIPGLKLRSLCDVTRQVLDKIWRNESTRGSRGSPSGSTRSGDEELAGILRDMEKPPGVNWSKNYKSDLQKSSFLLSDGTKFAEVLRERLIEASWDKIVSKFGIKEHSEKKNSVLDEGVGT